MVEDHGVVRIHGVFYVVYTRDVFTVLGHLVGGKQIACVFAQYGGVHLDRRRYRWRHSRHTSVLDGFIYSSLNITLF